MASRLSDLNSKIDAAIAAFEAGSYDLALTRLTAAQLLIATIPDTVMDGNDQIRFDRQGALLNIRQIRQQITARKAGSMGGVLVQPVEYRRAGWSDE